jgi:NAD(P)-dependent dehydrogenase (short-subunit alcohol dehydrogenase family)
MPEPAVHLPHVGDVHLLQCAQITRFWVRHHACNDVAGLQTPQAMIEHTLTHFGRLDMLVNHAGVSRPAVPDAPDAVCKETWTLNFTSGRPLR